MLCAVLLDTVPCITLQLKGDEAARADNSGGSPRPVGRRPKLSEAPDSKSRTDSTGAKFHLRYLPSN